MDLFKIFGTIAVKNEEANQSIDETKERAESAEMEIYSLLSRLSGIKTEDLKEMDAVIFFEMVVDVIKKPEFKDFYKVASGFIK